MNDNGLDATSTFVRVDAKAAAANRAANRLLYQSGTSMEEFPFASTAQGGPWAYLTQVSIAEQRAQGLLLANFYGTNGIMPGDPFAIWIDWGALMPQILDYFLDPLYGLVGLSGRDAELPWQVSMAGQRVLVDASAIAVAVADDEPEGQVEVEVYLGPDGVPGVGGLEQVYDGPLHLPGPGLLISAPTGDEVLLREIGDGAHHLEVYRDSYPSSRLVVLIDRAVQIAGPPAGS